MSTLKYTMANGAEPASGGERDEVAEAEAMLDRLYAIVGMGGYQGDPPPEMVLYADVSHGCDTWTHVYRLIEPHEVPEWGTAPVLYVRSDLDDALRLRAENERLRKALEEIDQMAPVMEPEYDDWGGDTEAAENYGRESGLWDAGQIARVALDARKEG